MFPLKNLVVSLLLALVLPWSFAMAGAISLESITVVALGPVDGRAVIRHADGQMQVVKLGDEIAGTQAVVHQVLTDKLVLEQTVEGLGASRTRQTVWIYKPDKPGEGSRVQRLDRQKPPGAQIEMPVVNQTK